MTIFRTYFKVAKKFKGSLIGYTAIFTVLMIIMLNTMPDSTVESYMDQSLSICVINHDNSEITDQFVDYLGTKHHLVTLNEDEDSLRNAIYNRSVAYILIIPEGYGESLLTDSIKELDTYTLPGSMNGSFIEMDMNSFLTTYRNYLSFGMDNKEAYATTIETLSKSTSTVIEKAPDTANSPIHSFASYYTYAIISLIITGLAPILIQFNQSEIKKRTLCSNVSILKRNVALTLGSGVYTIAILGVFVIIAFLLCGTEIANMEGLIRLLNAFIYSFVCLAIAFFITSFTNKINVLNMYSNIIGLGSSFLCGVFVSRDLLGENVSRIGRFLPAYWYVNVENEVSLKGFTLNTTVLTGFGVQILFFVAFMALALVVGKLKKR